MASPDHPGKGVRLPPAGLILQLFAIVLLPLTLLLVVITFGSIAIHQKAMRSMVGDRDTLIARAAAQALSAKVNQRVAELGTLQQLFAKSSPANLVPPLNDIEYLLSDFDAGIAICDYQGNLVDVYGKKELWNSWTANASWQGEFARLMLQARKPVEARFPGDNELYGFIPGHVEDKYVIIGGFSIRKLVETISIDVEPPGGQLAIMLVGADKQVLYKVGDFTDQTADHPGVGEALRGESGTLYVKINGDEHVTAYSPVASTGWALITEESWEKVSTPALRASQVAPLILVPAILIMLLALWLGARQVVKPLRELESKAVSLAGGDFKAIQKPVGGIAEIQHLQQELIQMAEKVSDAQRSLHGYIGAITAGQEDERRRLARELHDDTLQALIALKQRVQLAQYETVSASDQLQPRANELDEIATLTEQTIENLRRLTKALRPVYLEDLGLTPALEMLARETGETSDVKIEFHRLGVEKRLDAPVELALYRITQEALSNVSRHASATQVSIAINFSDDSVTLQVADDGVGFNVPKNIASYASNSHYGLLGMHERAELIGARLEIHSSPRDGTQLIVTLPGKT